MMYVGMKDYSYKSDKELEKIQEFNRQFLQNRAQELRRNKIMELQERIKQLIMVGNGCWFCRDLEYQNQLHFDCEKMLGLSVKNEQVRCPQCNRCLTQWHD